MSTSPSPTDIAALFTTALHAHHKGDLDTALAGYRKVLAAYPAHHDALNNSGAAHAARGEYEAAIASYRRALEYKPDFAKAWSNLGNALKDKGELGAAIDSYNKAISLDPQQAEAHYNLGTAYGSVQRWDDAAAAYKQALELKPDEANAHNNLGVVYLRCGKLPLAAEHLRRALQLAPDSAEVHANAGALFLAQQETASAISCFRRSLALAPQSALVQTNLGNALSEQGAISEALAAYKQALTLDPHFVDAWNGLGLALLTAGKTDAAHTAYQRALVLNPHHAEAHSNLGTWYRRKGMLGKALASYERALAISPGYADAHSNRAIALRDLGRTSEACNAFRQALALKPGHFAVRSNLLFTLASELCADDAVALACYKRELQAYGEALNNYVAGRAFTTWLTDDNERLRIAFVSGDFRAHPVTWFLESLLAALPAQDVEIVLYSTNPRSDAHTRRLQTLCSACVPLYGLSDLAAAQRIRADRIDVLVDLAGHTDHNRLPLFGFRPAPLQVSWLGYFASTGVRQMDTLVVDAISVPAGAVEPFTERLQRLANTRLCFTPPQEAPHVAPLPAVQHGFVTFGCFQNHAKVRAPVLALWSRIFSALPNARLRWQCWQFNDTALADATRRSLQQHGIDPARVTLVGAMPRADYLAAHAEVDLILDTFPYSGGTTTCEALWMGVPTLTLAGNTLLARQGASLLTAAGLTDWVTHSEADYIQRAVALANDLPSLAALRTRLRAQMQVSPLCDAQSFARNFVTPLRTQVFLQRAEHFKDRKEFARAEAIVRRLVASDAQHAPSQYLLGITLYDQGKLAEACERFETAVALKQDFWHAQWWLGIVRASLRVLDGETTADVSTTATPIDALEQAFASEAATAIGHRVVGLVQPFYVAYRAISNVALLRRYGALCSRLMGAWQQAAGLSLPAATQGRIDKRIRLGIVSSHIHKHSVYTALVKGWLQQLDAESIDLHVFYLGTHSDPDTHDARARCGNFVEGLTRIEQWTQAVLDARLDALIYPELGMDPFTCKLASMRLAPLQLASWGHPETTGLPTIDYYLSADLFEAEAPEAHYSERLLKLPNLGCCYARPDVRPAEIDVSSFGLSARRPLLLCPGNAHKYAPHDDWIVAAIAQRVPDAQFVFFANRDRPRFSEQLQQRMQQAFRNTGLAPEGRLFFIPWQREAEFFGWMCKADVFLDSVGFSGFNTAMQAAACALPIVTLDGAYLRGRLASGILKRMDMHDVVAQTVSEYIAQAERLATDPAFNQQVRSAIRARRELLFDDRTPIRALQHFLLQP